MNKIEENALRHLFQYQLDLGYLYFVEGDPVTDPDQLISAIKSNRKIISVTPN
tara:strand:- start:938 stop:1096 length:159 start_codon:yes stop_codon:yes gene_type:complete